jgi:cell division septum initiation protein DivIVA
MILFVNKNIEMYQVKEENEDLRDRIELLETIVQADSGTFEKYINSNLLNEAQKNQLGNYIGIDEG